jgi:hypothetical protein
VPVRSQSALDGHSHSDDECWDGAAVRLGVSLEVQLKKVTV